MPKISCIMPVYNTVKYLDEAIKSILDQSFGDFEFIISDDGSTDGSKEIIKKYALKDARIIFLDNPKNRGICANLNDMIAVAKGEFIAIMESDDISTLERFEILLSFLQNNNEVLLVGSCAQYIDEESKIFIEKVLPTKMGEIQSQDIFSMGIITPTFLFRKKIIELIGKFQYTYIWDYELYIRLIASKKGKIYNLENILVEKRIYGDSTYKKNWRCAVKELLSIRKEITHLYKLGKIRYIQSYFLFGYLFLLNLIRDFLSKSKYYKKIYSLFRRYLNFGL